MVGIGSNGVNRYSLAAATMSKERFNSGVNLVAELVFMYLGPKILRSVNTRVVSSDQAKAESRNYHPNRARGDQRIRAGGGMQVELHTSQPPTNFGGGTGF